MPKKIYLASPFFSDEQTDRVQRVEAALAANPTVGDVFSPRLHQHEEYELFSQPWREVTYAGDVAAIDEADVMVNVMDYEGDHVDPGTAWEFGYAVKAGVPVIAVKEKPGAVNLMMGMPLTAFITNIDDLATYDFETTPAIPYSGDIF